MNKSEDVTSMKKIKLLFPLFSWAAFLLSLAYLLSCCVFLFQNYRLEPKSWNAMIFTQQWPLTSCIDHMAKKHGASCNLYLNMTSWGVHGLWPTNEASHGPNFCNRSWVFDVQKIKDIEPLLIKYWPNIFKEESLTSLWEHEWLKHGTCAAELEQLNSEHKYFQKGIDLAMKFDLVSVLALHKIYPSDDDSYTLQDIYKSIKYLTNEVPIIDCIFDSKKKRHELSQIKICLDRKFDVIDCDKLKRIAERSNGNCPSEGIFYPASVRINNKTYRYSKILH